MFSQLYILAFIILGSYPFGPYLLTSNAHMLAFPLRLCTWRLGPLSSWHYLVGKKQVCNHHKYWVECHDNLMNNCGYKMEGASYSTGLLGRAWQRKKHFNQRVTNPLRWAGRRIKIVLDRRNSLNKDTDLGILWTGKGKSLSSAKTEVIWGGC